MLETASNPDDIEFVSYHDKDDTSKYEYVGRHKEVTGDRLYNYSQMWNECQKIAEGPLYLYQADDIFFETKGWDTRVKEVFENYYKDKIVSVSFNDRRHHVNNSCIFCVHKNWVDTLGYLTPSCLSSHCVDNWVNDIAKGVGRRVRLEDVFIKHHWISDDETHISYVKRRAEDPPWEIYKRTRGERSLAIQKLKNFIKNYGT